MLDRRTQRIYRALDHIIQRIDDAEAKAKYTAFDWRSLNEIGIKYDRQRIAAYDRCKRIIQRWQAIVATADMA